MHGDPTNVALATVAYVLAYLAGTAAFALVAKRRGMATGGIAVLAAAALFAGAFGAQLTQLVVGGVPGKSLLGGVICGYLAVLWAKRALGIRRPTGDLFAFAVATGEAIGRIGCFFAGCCYGKATHAAWGVAQHGALRHPTQLYSALAAAATLALLIALERRHALPENGLFFVQGACLCASRFFIEFFRAGAPAALDLTTVQLVCTLCVAYFGWRLLRLRVSPQRAVALAA